MYCDYCTRSASTLLHGYLLCIMSPTSFPTVSFTMSHPVGPLEKLKDRKSEGETVKDTSSYLIYPGHPAMYS